MTAVLNRDERQLLTAVNRHLRADGWTRTHNGIRNIGAHLAADWAYDYHVDGKTGRSLQVRLLGPGGRTERVALEVDVDSVQEAVDVAVAVGLLSQGFSSAYRAGVESIEAVLQAVVHG